MTHNFIPDPKTDGDYLAKVYGAAKLGHLEAMAKLGDYAYRRGAVVEEARLFLRIRGQSLPTR